jgi:hypothetical protein
MAGIEPDRHVARHLGDVRPLREAGLDGGLESGDEASEGRGAADESLEDLVALIIGHPPRRKCLRDPEDHRDRRAKLVAETRDELVPAGGPLQQRFLRDLELSGPAALARQGLGELLDDGGCHTGRDHPSPRGGLDHRVEDLLSIRILQDVPGGPRDEHVADLALILRTRERHDPD